MIYRTHFTHLAPIILLAIKQKASRRKVHPQAGQSSCCHYYPQTSLFIFFQENNKKHFFFLLLPKCSEMLTHFIENQKKCLQAIFFSFHVYVFSVSQGKVEETFDNILLKGETYFSPNINNTIFLGKSYICYIVWGILFSILVYKIKKQIVQAMWHAKFQFSNQR